MWVRDHFNLCQIIFCHYFKIIHQWNKSSAILHITLKWFLKEAIDLSTLEVLWSKFLILTHANLIRSTYHSKHHFRIICFGILITINIFDKFVKKLSCTFMLLNPNCIDQSENTINLSIKAWNKNLTVNKCFFLDY